MSKNEKDLKKGDVVDLFPEKTVQSKIRARESRKVNQDPVHQPNTKLKVLDDKGWYDKDKGISEAGADVRYYKRHKDEQATEKAYGGGAYGIHRRVLAALKKQPKPNLTRSESEDMSKSKLTKADIEKFDQELKKARVPNAKQHSGHGDREHGVHQDLTWDKGMSQMGNQARAGVTGSAKISSKVNLAELKSMPKPNLPKDKVEKAADPLASQLTPEKGVSDVGIEIRRADKRNPGVVSHGYGRVSSPEKHKDIAANTLKRLVDHIKKQPKPNLTKAKVDEGKSKEDKQKARSERHTVFNAKEFDSEAADKNKGTGAGVTRPDDKGVHAVYAKTPKRLKERHQAKLDILKEMPKPKLTRSDIEAFDQKLTKARVDEGKSPEIKAADRAQRHPINISSEGKKVGINQPGTKGVHAPGSEKPGISLAGEKIRVPKVPGGGFKDMSRKKAVVIAKDIHKQKLSELKAMPKPNLTASEGMSKAADPKDGGTLNYKQIKKDFINKKNSMQNAPKQAPAEPTNIKPHAPTNQNYGKLHDPQMSGTVNYKNPIKKADACGSLKRLAGSLKKVDPKTHLPGNLFEKSEKKDET
jgi:hypothetical protein